MGRQRRQGFEVATSRGGSSPSVAPFAPFASFARETSHPAAAFFFW